MNNEIQNRQENRQIIEYSDNEIIELSKIKEEIFQEDYNEMVRMQNQEDNNSNYFDMECQHLTNNDEFSADKFAEDFQNAGFNTTANCGFVNTWNLLDRINKSFGVGLEPHTGENGFGDYLNPSGWENAPWTHKKKIKKIIDSKKVVAPNTSGKKRGYNQIKIKFDWKELQSISIEGYFQKNSNLKKSFKEKPLESMENLLKTQKNLSMIDLAIKPKRLKELFTRSTEAPYMMRLLDCKDEFYNQDCDSDDDEIREHNGRDIDIEYEDFGYNSDGGSDYYVDLNGEDLKKMNEKNKKQHKVFKITDLKDFVWDKYLCDRKNSNVLKDKKVDVEFETIYQDIFLEYKTNTKSITVQSCF